jgi:hypothetical protein
MEGVDLGDERLNNRLIEVLSAFADHPQLSIPAACGGLAETAAAYRLFDNERVGPEKILEPHFQNTRKRIAEQPVALMVQDTTETDLTRPEQQVRGAGPLDVGSRQGCFLHPVIAFTPSGVPLGAVAAKMWARTESPEKTSSEERRAQRRVMPFEEKESFRWLEGFQTAREVAQQCPQTTCVCIGDSEADIYELFAEPRGEVPVHLLVRAAQDRALVNSPQDATSPCPNSSQESHEPPEENAAEHLRVAVLATPVLFTQPISIRGRKVAITCKTGAREQPRKSRNAELEVRATTVTLRAPRRSGKKLPPVTINVILAREINPPADEVPVEWLLLTTLPIDTVDQIKAILRYYGTRFMIEVFFRVLKSGCRIEERLFETLDRLVSCIAVYLIVAWRTLMVCRLGHDSPEMDCEVIFEPAEWKSVWSVTQREPIPAQPPHLGVMIRLVAQLGGYVNRPNRPDPPGPQTVWIGLQRTRDLAWAWNAFGPGRDTSTSALSGFQ